MATAAQGTPMKDLIFIILFLPCLSFGHAAPQLNPRRLMSATLDSIVLANTSIPEEGAGATFAARPMSESGRTRSLGNVGSMSCLLEKRTRVGNLDCVDFFTRGQAIVGFADGGAVEAKRSPRTRRAPSPRRGEGWGEGASA